MPPHDPPARSKPTPVRDALPGDDRRAEVRFEGRDLELEDGTRVWVEELGWGRSGRREDPGTTLVLLGFRPAEGEAFTREALVAGEGVAELTREQLLAAHSRGRPFQGIPEDRPFFGDAGRQSRERRGRRPPPRSG